MQDHSDSPATPLARELEAISSQLRQQTVHVQGPGPGGGSGVIWTSDGTIVTNAHVASSGQPRVQLADGRQLPATIRRRDPELDLAELHIDATGLPAAQAGDSDGLRVGELVLAVGHPWGVSGALTMGIVHAFGGQRGGDEWVLADLRLAPGNSGGPLADASGRVVGINSMISAGRAVAVPSRVVQRFLHSSEAPVHLGVTLQPVQLQPGGQWRLGLLLLEVMPGTPAERAGLCQGDVLVAVGPPTAADLPPLRAPGDLRRALRHAPGSLHLELLRAGQPLRVRVPLDPPKHDEERADPVPAVAEAA